MGPGTSPPYKEGRSGFGGIHTQKRRTSRWGWAALTKVLQGEGMSVIEVNRPDGQHRRLKGKIDSLGAYRAAQSVVSGRSTAVPEAKDGPAPVPAGPVRSTSIHQNPYPDSSGGPTVLRGLVRRFKP